ASHDTHCLAWLDGPAEWASREGFADDGKFEWSVRVAAEGFLASQRVAVHRGAVEARDRDGCRHVGREHSAGSLRQGHRLRRERSEASFENPPDGRDLRAALEPAHAHITRERLRLPLRWIGGWVHSGAGRRK